MRMRDATAQSQICCLQHREMESLVGWLVIEVEYLYSAYSKV